MGMLDNPTPFTETFKEGEVFALQDIKRSASEIVTDYGTGYMVLLKVNGKWYSIFGQALLSQIDRLDDDDRRAMNAGNFRVKIARTQTRKGQPMKLIVGENVQTSPSGEILSQDDIPF